MNVRAGEGGWKRIQGEGVLAGGRRGGRRGVGLVPPKSIQFLPSSLKVDQTHTVFACIDEALGTTEVKQPLSSETSGRPSSFLSLITRARLQFQSVGSPGTAGWSCMWGGRDIGLSLENRNAIVASLTPAWLGESASYMTAYTVTETFQRPSASQSEVQGLSAFILFFTLRKNLGSPGSCKSATVHPAVFPSSTSFPVCPQQ